jgi:hypothetical protein
MSITISGLGVMGYGAYLGVLIQARYFRNLDWPQILNTPWKQSILRALVVLGLAVPPGIIFLLVPKDAPIAVSIIFKTFVPLVLVNLSIFALSNYLFCRFKLVNLKAGSSFRRENGISGTGPDEERQDELLQPLKEH